MSNWEKNVRKVVPYVPGEQPHEADMIKLNTNENPYPPSPKAAEAIRRVAEEDTLRLYPDPTALMFRPSPLSRPLLAATRASTTTSFRADGFTSSANTFTRHSAIFRVSPQSNQKLRSTCSRKLTRKSSISQTTKNLLSICCATKNF